VIELVGVSKQYPGVLALDGVSVRFDAGRVHGLMGENGAGKSTLIKIMTGAIAPTTGVLRIRGVDYPELKPAQAIQLGISAVYQEFNLIPSLSVAQNIFFGREPVRGGIFQDEARMIRESRELIDRLGVPIDVRAPVRKLSVGFRQIVEIAKGISLDARVLILDEPTAALTPAEVERLYSVVRTLKDQGVAVIYISHRMQEIFDLCDQVTVLRDGRHVATSRVNDVSRSDLIKWMVGRELSQTYPAHRDGHVPGEVALEVRGLGTDLLRDVGFRVRYGEILGLAGLVGAGRTETVSAVFGADPRRTGEILLDGRPVDIRNPKEAIRLGIGLIPEDRQRKGVILQRPIGENMLYATLPWFLRRGPLQARQEELRQKLSVKTPSLDRPVKQLSGGNQQKVVLAKWLATKCRVLFFDEPTRGIDVGAKQEIYQLMRELAANGCALVMISSEMPELLGMSDRILVFCEGRITGELRGAEATQENIMELAAR
jgi:ribose transport system ATP-binding protein